MFINRDLVKLIMIEPHNWILYTHVFKNCVHKEKYPGYLDFKKVRYECVV